MNYNIEREIRDYIAKNLINGKLKPGDRVYELKYLTSLFKVNPNIVREALSQMEAEGLISKSNDYYIVAADENRISGLKEEFLNLYINDLVKNAAEIGMDLDDVIRILNLRNMANG